ncbi:retron St85 family RNA-directed DNA polymerase [Vibrio antiquarius]|uniref:retron St85 family RNA-directed DNA polymerase n=1 Tax=Vibrio antiquarius (strain Ex25) TaxID=150340 RepID=UPI002657E38F|nr:retron St85 family RNA-directed DNA polymerase [Vibrio antiquarius]MCS0024570.1 retron St85 family RNA-directed DNA polymerase [Vibrio antiquarius]
MLLELISNLTILEDEYILNVAHTSSQRYKKFYIPKKNGSLRAIFHPSKELKGIQRVIHDEVLKKLPSHLASSAYKKGSNIKKHAEQHKNANYLLRLDFKDFFESISDTDIINFANQNLVGVIDGWTEEDTNLLVDLATFKGGLTIGSITSPLLSDAICYNLDVILFSLSHELGITYTRYADDLYFSTNNRGVLKNIPPEVERVISSLEYPRKLKINPSKTHHSSKKNRMMVTGLTLTNDYKVSIGRAKKREIRSKIYNWKKLGVDEKNQLSGYLSYIKSVEPTFINTLCNKYGATVIREITIFNSGN